ncbi:hypothetical protein [Streptomyces sp. NPDC048187]|uniref:hypothetical protein n=1 Tax=Streptomyces sp. NPDC048187 TaxID=3365509 RepID=UPI00371B7293
MPTLREALIPVERRTFLTLSGAGLTGLTSQWAASSRPAAAHAGTVEPTDTAKDLVDALRTSADRLTAAAPAHEQHTTRLLAAHLHTVTDLLETGGHQPATQQRLHTLAAGLAHNLAGVPGGRRSWAGRPCTSGRGSRSRPC